MRRISANIVLTNILLVSLTSALLGSDLLSRNASLEHQKPHQLRSRRKGAPTQSPRHK